MNLPKGYVLDGAKGVASSSVPAGYVLDATGAATSPDTTALGAFGRGAVGMLPLGSQAYAGVASAAQNEPYAQERQELNQEIESDKLNNGGSRFAGQTAGVVAPLLIPGAGEALAAKTLAQGIGTGAAVGAGFGAGNAIDAEAIDHNDPEAIKSLLESIALGGASGGLGKYATGLLGKLSSGASEPLELEAGEGAARNQAGHPLNGPSPMMMPSKSIPMGQPSDISNIADGTPLPSSPLNEPATFTPASAPTPGAPLETTSQMNPPSDNELRARMLVGALGGSARQVRNLPGKNLVQTLNHMADVVEGSNVNGQPLIAALDRTSTRLQKFLTLQHQAGKTIGNTIDSAGVQPMSVQPILDTLQTAIKFPTPNEAAQLKGLTDQIKAYAGQDGTLSFQRLQQLKTDLDEKGFAGAGDPVTQTAYHVVGNAQDAELEKVAAQVNLPAFTKAKQQYQMLSRAIPMLRMATAKSLVNKPGLTELLSGHPLNALSSLVKEPLTRAANVIGFKGANALHGGNPLASMAAQATSAVSQSDKESAVMDYVNSQRDPSYAATKQERAEAQ